MATAKRQKLSHQVAVNPIADDEEEVDEPIPVAVNFGVAAHGPEDEEMDEPIPMEVARNEIMGAGAIAEQISCSLECSEALSAIASDCWDIGSWIIFLEEVENGRGGSITIPDAYNKLLGQFPCAAEFWKKLAEFYIMQENDSALENVFSQSLELCRNVDLWKTFLNWKKHQYSIKLTQNLNTEQYLAERKKFELIMNQAVDSIGISTQSYAIWRDYINFVKEWRDVGMVEASRRVNTLRALYQRIVTTPMDYSDEFYAEYENFEKVHAESSSAADAVLAEFNKKHLHAKSVLRERQKFMNMIVFDRLAVPPSATAGPMEAQQLDAWNHWIKFEMTNPDNLEAEALQRHCRLVFDQCLCCFRFHAEVWLSYAKYMSGAGNLAAGKVILRRAIDTNPRTVLLRVVLAETEELGGSMVECQEVLTQCFKDIPCGYTFAILQRYLRRTVGKNAARKLFSDTISLRAENPALSVEIYMAHAKLELQVNCEAQTAAKILKMAYAKSPAICIRSMMFVREYSRVLVRLGETNEMRSLLQTALNSLNEAGSTASIQDELILRTEFLQAELLLCNADIQRILELRDERDRLRRIVEDADRTKMGIIGAGARDEKLGPANVNDAAIDVLERYDVCVVATSALPEGDRQLRDRLRHGSYATGHQQQPQPRGSNGVALSHQNLGAEFQLSLVGLPLVLRDLLGKLPLHTGPMPDVDGFVRHLKSVVLPPQPAEESEFSNGKENADWIARLKDDNEDGEGGGFEDAYGANDDVFRQRQRAKLLAANYSGTL